MDRIELNTNGITEYMIDSHAHLSEFENAENIARNMQTDKLCNIINMTGSIKSVKDAVEFSKIHPEVYYMVGLHPYDIENFNDEFVSFLTELSKTDDHFVGIGEIGLDYHGEYKDKELQKYVFLEQIKLADKLALPISMHIRDAHGDAIMLLNNNKNYLKHGGIVHCFSGTEEEMQKYLALGFHISFSGSVTFKKKSESESILDRCAKLCPLDKILIETDSPFLCPAPFRGNRNEPRFVVETARYIANLRCMDVNDFIKITTANAKKLIKKFK